MVHKFIMIKRIFYTVGAVLLTATGLTAQQRPFVLNGTVDGLSKGKIYIVLKDYSQEVKSTIDSTSVQDGKFIFKGFVDGAREGWISKDKNPKSLKDFLPIILSPGNLILSVNYNDLYESELKGTKTQKEAYELQKMKKGLATRSDIARVEAAFMDTYPNSYVSAAILQQYVKGVPYAEAKQRYGKLSPEILVSPIGKILTKNVTALQGGSPGAVATAFSTLDINGTALKLADYKGKYVLLDFWASWCVPCRAGNPHLLGLYAQYKDKGFEIIGIADNDSSPEVWKKAVAEDKIGVWKHVLRTVDRPAEMRLDLSQAYGITSLPTKILIDPKGVIVARIGGGSGLDDAAMDKLLAGIFNQSK